MRAFGFILYYDLFMDAGNYSGNYSIMRIADAKAISSFFGISYSTIRYWAHVGKIARRGTDRRGRTLYLVAEVLRHAKVSA